MNHSGKNALLGLGASLLATGIFIVVNGCGKANLSSPQGISSSQPIITNLSPTFVVAGTSSQQVIINGHNFSSSSSVLFNGTFHSTNFVSSQQIDLTLEQPDLAVAGNYSIAVVNQAPGGSSTPASFGVWNKYQDPSTGIELAFPVFGSATQLATSSPSGSVISFDVQAQNTSQQSFASILGISVYLNSTGADLQQWFESNVDIDGILLANNTFQQEQFANGVTALIISGPVPSQYLDIGSPVEQVYAMTPDRRFVFTMTEGQEAQFGDFGYQPLILYPQILGVMSFQ